jgi:hypothetical protein
MASVTLVESAKLAQNELVAGVIENVITVNKSFEVIPFDGIDGNALAYNRENALGDVDLYAVGTQMTSKAAATFTPLSVQLTSILGDAEVNGLIQATRSGDGNDQTAVQIASKAKSAGRKWQDQFINGTGVAPQFQGLISACASGQKVDTGASGGALSFLWLDELLDLVTDKDGMVDFITSHARTLRSFNALLRALGGASISDTVQLPSGARVPAYRETPWFRNDYIPINQVKGVGSAQTTVFAGTFDDGSRQHGLAGLTAEKASGIHVVDVGEKEDYDEHIWRVKWYAAMALFSEKGLACAEGITN